MFFRSGPIQQAISSKRTSGMIGSEIEKMELVTVSYPPFCKFYIRHALFNYFNLCEIIRHFDWSRSLIRGTGPKKLKIFQLFIIRPATSPDQSEQNISTDVTPVRSAAYFPEWKLAFRPVSDGAYLSCAEPA
jgi:hypothetical protein